MPESIHLSEEAVAKAAEILLAESALEFCASISGDTVTADRPVSILSSGEKALWRALEEMSLGLLPPDDVFHAIDEPSKVALTRAIQAFHDHRFPGLMRLWEAVAEGNTTAIALSGLSGGTR